MGKKKPASGPTKNFMIQVQKITTMMEAKPCPFCASPKAPVVYNDADDMDGYMSYVQRGDPTCRARGPLVEGQDKAVSRWNERAT